MPDSADEENQVDGTPVTKTEEEDGNSWVFLLVVAIFALLLGGASNNR